jgi:asparagine synthase (glutamine-hydrolysing)
VSCGSGEPFDHKLLSSLRRRGPDASGFWVHDDVAIGHTRLSVIGLDDRGTQPLENHRHVLAFNGEIYNFIEIRRQLADRGIEVAGTTDSEVLLHAWTTWGSDVLARLVGFWAFVVYDKVERTLTLVRDQFGVKPLYYYSVGGRVVIGSTLGSIRDSLRGRLELDFAALSEYVRYQYTFADRTFFKDVKKVVPGNIVQIDLKTGTSTQRVYENIFTRRGRDEAVVDDSWYQEARARLSAAVVESTISDTSFTTFCSGGIDSSLITRLASPEIAYHCNYTDPECNETFFARQVVEGTSTRLFTVNAGEDFDLVDRLADIVRDFDELTIGSVILPLDDLLSQVKRRYKVILTGTGGDEMFAGYVRFQLVLGDCNQDSYRGLFERVRKEPNARERFALTHQKGDPAFYRFYESSADLAFRDAYDECAADSDSDLDAMLQFDRRYFLQGLLNIDDKMCGRHSLESRPSFLHQGFVRFLMNADPRAFLGGAALKPVLRRIARGTLPNAVIDRTDKMGFTTPIGTFVNRNAHRIRERVMDSPFGHLYDLRRMSFHAESKFSREVFGLLMLDLWLQEYASPNG